MKNNTKMTDNKNRFTPLLMSLCVVIGIVIGSFYANHFSGNRLNIISNGSNKLSNLLHIIDDQYVDKVDMDSLVEKAIPQILAELDPHSVYIPAADVEKATDELKGSFTGVGIEFTGTKVKITVKRFGHAKPITYTVTRGEIPTKTITATYMLDENTGYIKVNSFGEKTYPELLIALADLSQQGFSNLVIDLRDNVGGYMQSAVQMANEFLPKGKLIVYMEGRKQPRKEFRTDGHGAYQKIPLVILINEETASAAEIFSGAMQDNDRATIIGRRSFGKGLVQQQIPFPDGSMIRLTIARYYTPSGRCIQKPYVNGEDENYAQDLLTRYQRGEYFSQDSIKHTGPAYHTGLGRIVYGGGGITPDIFVAEDTANVTSYYKQAILSGLILQYAYTYTDNNRAKMKQFQKMLDLAKYLEKQNLVGDFVDYADHRGLQRRNLLIRKSYTLLDRFINSRIIYNMLDEQALYEYLNQDDPAITMALKVFRDHAAFPKAPAKKAATKKR